MNKRFLGLGFTFTAQDRGLGKKLTEYSDALKSIKESLDSIKASGAIGVVMGEPVGQSSRSSGAAFSSAKAESSEQQTKQKSNKNKTAEKPKGQVVYSDDTKAFLNKIATLIPKELFGGLAAELDKLNLSIDEHGNMLEESKKKLLNHVDTFVQAQKDIKKTRFLETIRGVSEYLKGIASAFGQLLNSFGLNLRSLIPPQLSAAFNVLKAIVAGPLNVIKTFTGNTMAGLMKKQVSAIDKLKSELNEQIGNKAGPSVKDYLQMLISGTEATKENKDAKGGLMGAIRRFLDTAFGGLIGYIVGFGKRFGKLFGLIWDAGGKLFNFLRNFVSKTNVFQKLIQFGGRLGTLFGEFGSIITSIGSRIGLMIMDFGAMLFQTILPFAVIGTAIAGFAKGLWDNLDLVKNAVMLLWDGLKEFGKGLWSVVGVFITKPLEYVSSGIRVVGDLIFKIFEMIYTGYKKIGGLFGSLVTVSLDSAGDALRSAGKEMQRFSAEQRASVPDSMGSRADEIRAKSDAIIERGLETQQQEQKKTNELLTQLIQQMSGNTNKVNVSLSTKGSLSALFSKAEISAANSGST